MELNEPRHTNPRQEFTEPALKVRANPIGLRFCRSTPRGQAMALKRDLKFNPFDFAQDRNLKSQKGDGGNFEFPLADGRGSDIWLKFTPPSRSGL